MPDEKTSTGNGLAAIIALALVSGVVGLVFVGSQQSKRNEQNLVDDLPALRSRVTGLESMTQSLREDLTRDREASAAELARERESITQIRTAQAEQLDRAALNDIFRALDKRIDDLEAQLGRRIGLEIKEPFQREMDDLQNLILRVDRDSEDNENKIAEALEKIAEIRAKVEALESSG